MTNPLLQEPSLLLSCQLLSLLYKKMCHFRKDTRRIEEGAWGERDGKGKVLGDRTDQVTLLYHEHVQTYDDKICAYV